MTEQQEKNEKIGGSSKSSSGSSNKRIGSRNMSDNSSIFTRNIFNRRHASNASGIITASSTRDSSMRSTSSNRPPSRFSMQQFDTKLASGGGHWEHDEFVSGPLHAPELITAIPTTVTSGGGEDSCDAVAALSAVGVVQDVVKTTIEAATAKATAMKMKMKMKMKFKLPESEQEADYVDTALAKEMEQLSMAEHEKLLFNIHGLDTMCNVTGRPTSTGTGGPESTMGTNDGGGGTYNYDPDDIEEKLVEMEHELQSILLQAQTQADKSSIQTMNYVLEKYPTYVNDRSFRLLFLRSEHYNCRQAAEKMIKHFDVKEGLFGGGPLSSKHQQQRYDHDDDDAAFFDQDLDDDHFDNGDDLANDTILGRDIRVSDLNDDDQRVLYSGMLQFLPITDTQGRYIFLIRPQLYYYMCGGDARLSAQNVLRSWWYIFNTTLRTNDNCQKNGIVIICYMRSNANQSITTDTSMVSRYRSSLCQHSTSTVMSNDYEEDDNNDNDNDDEMSASPSPSLLELLWLLPLTKELRWRRNSSPTKIVSIHFCYDHPSFKKWIAAHKMFSLSSSNRARTRTHHYTDHASMMFQLQTYGIPINDYHIPPPPKPSRDNNNDDGDGDIASSLLPTNMDWFHDWLSSRTHIEQEQEQEQETRQHDHYNEEIITTNDATNIIDILDDFVAVDSDDGNDVNHNQSHQDSDVPATVVTTNDGEIIPSRSPTGTATEVSMVIDGTIHDGDEDDDDDDDDDDRIIPEQYDVLFGKGKKTMKHTGNVTMYQMIELSQHRYEKATKFVKTEIAEQIVSAIHESEGRFLKWNKNKSKQKSQPASSDKDTGYYEVVDHTAAREKVSHYFRHLRNKKPTLNKNDTTTTTTTMQKNEINNSGTTLSIDNLTTSTKSTREEFHNNAVWDSDGTTTMNTAVTDNDNDIDDGDIEITEKTSSLKRFKESFGF